MPPEPHDRDTIFTAAALRAREVHAPMQGLLTPREAHALFAAGAIDIVDTRTAAERDLIGYVPGSIHIEWYDYPAKARNPHFMDQLVARVEPDRPVAFLCRSGVRSHHAATAAAQAGFTRVYNVLEGFEGDQDEEGRRGTLGGWRRAGLPWTQH